MGRRHVSATFALAAALAAFIGLASTARADDKVLFQTDWIPSGEHAMYFGGWEKGLFKKHGIDVTIVRGYGSGDTVTKVGSGAADFGVADLGALFTARARTNIPVKLIMQLYAHSPHSMFVLKSSGIKDFKDLAGKKIGITPGNSHRVYFPRTAKLAGLDANSVTWVNTDGAAMAGLLIAKRLDATPFFAIHHYYQNKAAKRAGEEIVVLPFAGAGFAIYATGIVTTDKMIREKPDLTRRFVAAVAEAFIWARDHPDEACTLHVKRVPEVAHDDCLGSLRAVVTYVFNDHSKQTGLGKHDPQRLKFTYEIVAEAQTLDPKWDFAQAVDLSFLPR
jgi:NitT/TauT family transport system substrate-binding protein